MSAYSYDGIFEFLNTDFVNALSNLAQFYNIYQSTKSANYSEMVSELQRQNSHIDKVLDLQTHEILNKITEDIKNVSRQNEIIINQNKEIIDILKSGVGHE